MICMHSGMDSFDVTTTPTQLFVNNEFVDALSKQTFKTVNPATEAVICEVQSAGAADVDAAVAAARAAFPAWKLSNGCDRRDLLLKLASLIERDRDTLAKLESIDNGKPAHVANKVDIGFVIEAYRYYV